MMAYFFCKGTKICPIHLMFLGLFSEKTTIIFYQHFERGVHYTLHYKTATLPLLVADDCAQDDENGLETLLKKNGK